MRLQLIALVVVAVLVVVLVRLRVHKLRLIKKCHLSWLICRTENRVRLLSLVRSRRGESPPFVYKITDEWRLDALNILLKKVEDPDSLAPETLNKVSVLIWSHFKTGGMKTIARLIPHSMPSHKIAFKIFSFCNFKFIEKMIFEEFENVRVYLQFLRFCFNESKDDFLQHEESANNQDEAKTANSNSNSSSDVDDVDRFPLFVVMVRVAIRVISTYGSSDRRVAKIVSLSVNLLNEARESSPDLFRRVVFGKVGQGELKFSIGLIEKSMQNQSSGKRMKLKKFSLAKRDDINDKENEDGVPIPNIPPA